MKTSLQLKIGQQLTMTPQLQQAIRLLQLSTLDLQQEIQTALESNPMLEVAEDLPPAPSEGKQDESGAHQDTEAESAHESDSQPAADEGFNESIPEDLPVDTAWEDIYQGSTLSYGSAPPDEEFDFESRNSQTESLRDHLSWQLNLMPMSEPDRRIAEAIIDAIDDDGYLMASTEEILESVNRDLEEPVNEDEFNAVLKRIQHLDPTGVGARNLQECLLIQLNQLAPDTPWLNQARKVVHHYLHLLGNRDYAQVMRRARLKEHELKEVLRLIQSLNPKPGSVISTSQSEYVIPDVIVRKHEGAWRVELNPEIAPRIRVNPMYASLVRRADNSADNTYLKDQLQEARWFIKSLRSRNETLLKVATKIVEHQQAFLEHGEEAMKPLVLHDIAEAVGMHESTISRVTTQKYMHTPRGVFELKYFFSSHVSTDSGGECSSTAIRAMIRKLIADEPPKKPLSDSKIAALLGEQGIQVARRTVAKYREAMNIPPSNERKRLI
ncbi:RNA polymerase factor sigma-54 [Hahella sp. SMD15-11]|uniref:RNA polymerase sigma-54 factor n=1 Tax=Thermohahella caldifontis TaxID=3142973 RepID=A0AB39UZ14_9GAMM